VSAPRRQASRYPGAGASSAQLQNVPVVVWLEGALLAASPADTVSIGQLDKQFVPGGLAIRTGTVVRFPNDDPFYHNVFSYSGPRFDLGRYAPGTSREVRLDEAGLVEIYCEIHQFMRAVVVVTDHGFGAVAAPDGTFRLTDVPPGSYTLKAYHPDHGTTETPLVVTAGATTRARFALSE
jgi:plastocyanin